MSDPSPNWKNLKRREKNNSLKKIGGYTHAHKHKHIEKENYNFISERVREPLFHKCHTKSIVMGQLTAKISWSRAKGTYLIYTVHLKQMNSKIYCHYTN